MKASRASISCAGPAGATRARDTGESPSSEADSRVICSQARSCASSGCVRVDTSRQIRPGLLRFADLPHLRERNAVIRQGVSIDVGEHAHARQQGRVIGPQPEFVRGESRRRLERSHGRQGHGRAVTGPLPRAVQRPQGFRFVTTGAASHTSSFGFL